MLDRRELAPAQHPKPCTTAARLRMQTRVNKQDPSHPPHQAAARAPGTSDRMDQYTRVQATSHALARPPPRPAPPLTSRRYLKASTCDKDV